MLALLTTRSSRPISVTACNKRGAVCGSATSPAMPRTTLDRSRRRATRRPLRRAPTGRDRRSRHSTRPSTRLVARARPRPFEPPVINAACMVILSTPSPMTATSLTPLKQANAFFIPTGEIAVRRWRSARTVNVPRPSIFGGTAVNRKPSRGSASSAVRCSMIGMSLPSRAVCTGRPAPSGPSMASMFSESIPTHATPASTSASCRSGREMRVPLEIRRRREVATVVGAEKHGAASEIEIGQMFGPDAVDASTIDADARHVGNPFQRQTGQIVTVGEAVVRHVDVGPGVRADRDHADRERDAGTVDGLRRLAVEVVEDVRSGKPRVRRQTLGDRMAEIDEAGGRWHHHSLPRSAAWRGQLASDASSVISGTAANALLTGHPFLAASACSLNAASSIPGTRPTVTRSILLMVGAPSIIFSVTVASVCTESGGLPALASMFDKAIEKHAACAAAINCSGFEPGPSSKRDLAVYPPLMRISRSERARACGQVTLPLGFSLCRHVGLLTVMMRGVD